MPNENNIHQPAAPNHASPADLRLQEVNEEIYKHNLELATVNKILSLLRKLYHISLTALDPASLSKEISKTVQVDLNMEIVGILVFDKETDSLTPFIFSKSKRLTATLAKLGFLFSDIKITHVSQKPTLKEVVYNQKFSLTKKLEDIWDGIDHSKLQAASEESHLKTILLYPLVAQKSVIGILFLGTNRDYETLSQHERDSIKSIIDVTAVGLDKMLLYEKLETANEHLRELDREKSEFVSIASHQLRTPLTAISGYASMLLEGSYGKLSKKTEEAVSRIYQSSGRLVLIIEDFLNITKIEQGKMNYQFMTVDMKKLLRELVEEMEPLAHEKKLELTLKIDDEGSFNATADFGKIRQVMSNLIDNGIKYSSSGNITVLLSRSLARGKIYVSVHDTGIGISQKTMEKLFQKFSRAEGVKKIYTEGSGLGLYVAQEMIKAHHGRIWAESEGEGKGSTFHVELMAED